jgi:acyl-CoA synthetase (NDP forming)
MSTENNMRSAARFFFTSKHIAVAGASSAPHKFGNRIFAWYLQRLFNPIALNPSSSSITVQGREFVTTSSPKALEDPTQTSLSVITPPPVTKELLKECMVAAWDIYRRDSGLGEEGMAGGCCGRVWRRYCGRRGMVRAG